MLCVRKYAVSQFFRRIEVYRTRARNFAHREELENAHNHMHIMVECTFMLPIVELLPLLVDNSQIQIIPQKIANIIIALQELLVIVYRLYWFCGQHANLDEL